MADETHLEPNTITTSVTFIAVMFACTWMIISLRNVVIPNIKYKSQSSAVLQLSTLITFLIAFTLLVCRFVCSMLKSHYHWALQGIGLFTFTYICWCVLVFWVTYRVVAALSITHGMIWKRSIGEMNLLNKPDDDESFEPADSETLIFFFHIVMFCASVLYIVLRLLTNDITELF
jgi:hypothetical protein